MNEAITGMNDEDEAIRRYEAGEKLNFSTGICESITFGYGRLSDHGYWEFPLPYDRLRPNDKRLVDEIEGRDANGLGS